MSPKKFTWNKMFSFSNWISTKVFSWSIIYKKKLFLGLTFTFVDGENSTNIIYRSCCCAWNFSLQNQFMLWHFVNCLCSVVWRFFDERAPRKKWRARKKAGIIYYCIFRSFRYFQKCVSASVSFVHSFIRSARFHSFYFHFGELSFLPVVPLAQFDGGIDHVRKRKWRITLKRMYILRWKVSFDLCSWSVYYFMKAYSYV